MGDFIIPIQMIPITGKQRANVALKLRKEEDDSGFAVKVTTAKLSVRILPGSKLQVRFAGSPLQLRVTPSWNAGFGYAKTLVLMDCPALTDSKVLAAEMMKSAGLMGKARDCDGPPPGDPLNTESCSVPVLVKADAGKSKTKSVEPNTYVRAGAPFTRTTELKLK